MPIHVRASSELGLAVLVFEGVVTVEEWDRHVAPLVETPEYSLMPLTLVDMTAALRGDGPSDIVRLDTPAEPLPTSMRRSEVVPRWHSSLLGTSSSA